ncbi:MAG: hypothetical protein JXA66_08880, partial [Oligoflexia bacterium]|nr:hypothetical protein [Oligoflexia bacterium]
LYQILSPYAKYHPLTVIPMCLKGTCRLDDTFNKSTILTSEVKTIKVEDSDERVYFVVAAYNAGEGRIAIAQKLAKKAEENYLKWDIVKNI